ncbi:response regulator [Lysinibacillus pakistanensis]|uniref:LytR/AlgR family response regulator transcription factor n=1 Tax=Lysinibacillus pakistanensis TaxID=759811 RepID=UPI003D2BB599
MKIVIVDDENQSLKRLKSLLKKSNNVSEVDIVGEYTNFLEVVAQIQTMQPDVVFLDIVMPDMDGLTLGKRVRELLPNIEIVFTSVFDKYAIDAFNLHAIDYSIKACAKNTFT